MIKLLSEASFNTHSGDCSGNVSCIIPLSNSEEFEVPQFKTYRKHRCGFHTPNKCLDKIT